MGSRRAEMRVGVLIGGDNAVRAAHSLSADPLVEDVVVVGPAKSSNFEVVDDAAGINVLIGSGRSAPRRARELGLPLVWDGEKAVDGVAVWGASISGLGISMASRQRGAAVAAVAHPDLPQGDGQSVRFPRPVGATQVTKGTLEGQEILAGKSYNEYAACLIKTKRRDLTIVDRSAYLSGIALAAGIAVFGSGQRPVWAEALKYLETATGMGLVMAEA